VKLTREKRIEDAEKRKEGQFLSGSNEERLRDTIDCGAENTPAGVTTRWNQGSKTIEDDSNDDDVASEQVSPRRVVGR
jgi:hypothetical protein